MIDERPIIDSMPTKWPSRFCCDEDLALIGYDGRFADQELAKWREGGPRPTTQELIDVVRAGGIGGATLVEIGAGVGAVHTALLEAGAAAAVDVDASQEYIAAAREEAERRGLSGRVDYRYGDIVELAPTLEPADIVLMDSVICCYPDLPALLKAAVMPRPRLVGLIYPRDVWWMIGRMRMFNGWHSMRRSVARYFIYRRAHVSRLMTDLGYAESYDGGSPAWRVATYVRE